MKWKIRNLNRIKHTLEKVHLLVNNTYFTCTKTVILYKRKNYGNTLGAIICSSFSVPLSKMTLTVTVKTKYIDTTQFILKKLLVYHCQFGAIVITSLMILSESP